MDIQKIKDDAYREAVAELKREYADSPEIIKKLKQYEETNGKNKTREISP